MFKKLALMLAAILLGAALIAWLITEPRPLSVSDLPAHTPDVSNGELFFYAGGCASCHAAPGAKDDAKLVLSGGLDLPSPFGTFRVPNISPDPTNGIGGWSDLDFVNALVRGVSPQGSHYYPSFPYTSYRRMAIPDLLDLKAYLDTLPPSAQENRPHDLPFPFTIRRSLGFWKAMFGSSDPEALPDDSDLRVQRGQYLVEGPGHCGECHTPRNPLGGLRMGHWLAGGPNPEGEGTVPNITGHSDGLGDWSAADIASYLKTGLSPDFEVVGGSMQPVQANMAHLSDEDRAAIGAYLKAVPARPNGYKKSSGE